MNRILKSTAILLLPWLLAACVEFRPLPPEEQIRRQNLYNCTEETNSMIGPKFKNELAWSWYFDRCMKKRGYSDSEVRDMRPSGSYPPASYRKPPYGYGRYKHN